MTRIEEEVKARGNLALSPRLDAIREWWSQERFAAAWEQCLRSCERHVLLAYLSVPDGRVVRSWLYEGVVPSWPYLTLLDYLFTYLIGSDWMEQAREGKWKV